MHCSQQPDSRHRASLSERSVQKGSVLIASHTIWTAVFGSSEVAFQQNLVSHRILRDGRCAAQLFQPIEPGLGPKDSTTVSF
eukprot:2602227-Amphidinium_carterae.1